MSIQTQELRRALLPAQTAPERSIASIAANGARLIDPLQEPASWDALVASHSAATLFHTSAWARVLSDTYGHKPAYLARQQPNRSAELLPVMEVNSPWTGRRGVALPFTDGCPPLGADGGSEASGLFEAALNLGRARGWKYLETRGGGSPRREALPSVTYYGHQLCLARSEAELFAGLDGAVRRGVRKAGNADLRIERNSNLESVRAFYRLHCHTRRRQGVPPQPFRFFEKISQHVLEAGHGDVFTALHGSKIVAAAVFFQHGSQVIYKFGASDRASQGLRPNNLLMLEAIKWYASRGMATLDFGRTSLPAAGLRRFKLGFGTREERLEYFRFDLGQNAFVRAADCSEGWINALFRWLPTPFLELAGRLAYPHLS
jgi:hypothetical protein